MSDDDAARLEELRQRRSRRQPLTRDELVALLEAGTELTPGEAARVLNAGRTTIHELLEKGLIGYRHKAGTGRHRLVDPVDLLRHLRETEQKRRGQDEGGPAS